MNIRWTCAKPTDPPPPVYRPGTAGWFHQRAGEVLAGEKTMAEVVLEAKLAGL